MKVLVTGAAGYIGSVLVSELLTHGHQVLGFDDLSCQSDSLVRYAADPSFSFVRGDVRREDQLAPLLRRVDAAIPLAAIVGMPACDAAPDRAREINVEAIRLLLRLRANDQRVVFPNTNSGYGTQEAGTSTCTEETPLAPISLYGRLKCEAEALVLAEKNTATLRLATVFGLSPRMRRDLLVNNFVWRALKDRKIDVYEGSAMRNYVHVRDVARAFRRVLENDELAGAYNFGNDAINLSKWDLARKITEQIPHVELLAGDGADPDKRNYVVSSRKLSLEGDITARVGLPEGIHELIRGYRCLPELALSVYGTGGAS